MRPCHLPTIGVHFLFFASGAVALICEVVWTRWLTSVLGSASAATAIVLAVFMAGLGLGSWLSGQLADRVRQPIRLYAALELGIATLILLPLAEVPLFGVLFKTMAATWGPVCPALDWARFGAAVVAVGPPTILMGTSLPLVVRAMASSGELLGRRTATAYAANSLGGVVGTLLAGFFLIEMIGLRGTALVAAGVALTVGVAGLLLDRWTLRVAGSSAGEICRNSASESFRKTKAIDTPHNGAFLILLAAAAAGFCGLGYETIWSRLLTLLTLNTTYAFSLMLAVLLCGLCLGSWLVGWRLDRLRDPAAWFVAIQILLSLYALSSLLWASSILDMTSQWMSADPESLLPVWFGKPLIMSACLLLLPSMAMGASLPLVCKLYASVTTGVGRPVGRAYAANTFGSVVGASLIGLVVIPSLGTSWAVSICAAVGSIAAAGVAWLQAAARLRLILTFGASAAVTVSIAFGLAYGGVFITQQGLSSHDEVVFQSEDEYGLVEVVEDQRLGTRWMLTNRLHWEGSTLPRAVAEQRKQGLLPLVLHKSPRRVLEIGLGTGVKLSSLDSAAVEEAVVVEISPGVIKASRLFAKDNHDVGSSASKVLTVCGDGRNFVALTPHKYDVIVNGLLTPYRAGVSRLYTVEHFHNCREKLAEGGMFVVWVAIRQIAPDDLKVLTRTLLKAFPHTTVWLDGYYLAFVSTELPLELNADEVRRRCADIALADCLDEAGLDSPESLLATFVAGPKSLARYSAGQPLNTEDRPLIEFRTPRLGNRLNSSQLAAEILGTLSMLQEPLCPTYAKGTETAQAQLQRAQEARWVARQGLIEKCYGNYVVSAELFCKALALDPNDDLARYELEVYLVAHGKQCTERGLLARARRVFRQAVQVNPRSVGALASLATLEEEAGNHLEAEDLWQRALSLDPDNTGLRRRVTNLRASNATSRY